ncbi:hypothetical protein [Rheinheimera nanhaiensis]|uniref:Uncharacterized protein n=1 Tax=Rheinheimera nanhaiensis E407-8 TaxID=562729 RepID=I1DX45_9GAMM|nr:hypothetical protein [Rheinheimera nanhaiensis]GAB58623.1 hypothetical protein RNAN_1603 [Rheinheimera nanhaiensis E407-8]
MKTLLCPACRNKVSLKQAAATKKVNGILMLQCANCQQWSHENQKAAVVKKLGLILLITGSVMGYFQLGGTITGPLIAVIGGLIAVTTLLAIPRVIYNGT